MLRSRFLIVPLLVAFTACVAFGDDKSKRDRDAAAAVAMQMALRETAPAPKAGKPVAPMPKIAGKAERDKKAAAALQAILSTPNYSYVDTPGWHTHECPVCGSEWSHSDANRGNLDAHRCPNPNCNGMSLDPAKRNTRIEERKDAPDDEPQDDDDDVFLIGFTAGPPCPNGNCPTARSYSFTPARSVVIIRNAPPATVTKTTVAKVAAPVTVSRVVYSARQPIFHGQIRHFFGRVLFGRGW